MSQSSRISQVFADCREAGRMAFMPFIAAGDPDISDTRSILKTLSAARVDLIELGFPYSDPIADGPVIQAAYTRALDKGLAVEQIFECVRQTKAEDANLPPVLAMVAYAIIFRIGPEDFLKKAVAAGFSGLIVPDLPGDEAEDFAELVRRYPLDLVQLIAPTTPEARVSKILQTASGFLYCISIAGTTGARDELPAELNAQLRDLKSRTDLPLAVGFGISKPDQVDLLRDAADGVIVGSAIVRQLAGLSDGSTDLASVTEKVGNFCREMVAACGAR